MKPRLWVLQAEESQVFRLSSLLKRPMPLQQVGVGPEIKTHSWD